MAIVYRNTAVTAAGTSTELSSAKQQRQFLFVSNVGTTVAYLAINEPAVVGSGIAIQPGSVVSISPIMFDRDTINEVVNCISASGIVSLSVCERYVDGL